MRKLRALTLLLPLLLTLAAGGPAAVAHEPQIPPEIVKLTLASLPASERAESDLIDDRHWGAGKLHGSSGEFLIFMPVFGKGDTKQTGLFVFEKTKPAGHYQFVTRSPLWAERCEYMDAHSMCNDTVYVSDGYLWYWRLTESSDCDRLGRESTCMPTWTQFQFRNEDNTIRLIGMDVSIYQGADGMHVPQPPGHRIADCSVNYVTRRKIVWEGPGGPRAASVTQLDLTGPLVLDSFVPYSELVTLGGLRGDITCNPDDSGGFTEARKKGDNKGDVAN